MSIVLDNNDLAEETDYTLSFDSFDKLLEPRPVLRELKLLKKDVRASFNMNSSVENCSGSSSLLIPAAAATPLRSVPGVQSVINANRLNANSENEHHSISTPVQTNKLTNPFKCSLSPIGTWKFRFFENINRQKDKELSAVTEKFDATPINPDIVIIDHDTEKEKSRYRPSIKEHSTFAFPLKRLPSKDGNRLHRHVGFEVTKVGTNKSSRKSLDPPKKRSSARLSTQKKQQKPTSLILQAGKWRKSLNIWRRTNQLPFDNGRKSKYTKSSLAPGAPDDSVQIIGMVTLAGYRKSVFFKRESELGNCTQQSNSIWESNEWSSQVLQRCGQRKPLPFNHVYKAADMLECHKIGEGVYGEVFMNQQSDGENTVLKIIPIEGHREINGEAQKTYEQILPEIIITMELCNLCDVDKFEGMYATSGFVGIKKVSCVEGRYPAHLLKLWEEYDNNKGSENDHPEVLPDTQKFIILELSFGGKDLETFLFNNAEQSYYALQQIVLSLAVGEEAYQFEHRDLHWGNVLLSHTSEKNISYRLAGKPLTLPTKGIRITIIDYTLSRMTFDGCCLYNDLSNDEELFSATGDYQFDIYRMMRDVLGNNWEIFEPKTNVFWISYITAKLLNGVSYKSTRTKTHSNYMSKLRQLQKITLSFNSATDFAKYLRKTA